MARSPRDRSAKNGVLASFYILLTTAEFVAHFCQFNYLLEHGSRAYFDAALHQITEAVYALSITSTGITENYSEFMTTEASRAIAAVMSTHLLRERYENFRRDKAWLQNQAMRGIALILTLVLIDEKEDMIRFIHADRVDRSLEQKLTASFRDVGVMKKVALINEQILSLQGSLYQACHFLPIASTSWRGYIGNASTGSAFVPRIQSACTTYRSHSERIKYVEYDQERDSNAQQGSQCVDRSDST